MAGLATPDTSVVSPSGKHVLKVRRAMHKNSPALSLDVYAAQNGQLVYHSEDHYLDRFTTYFAWDDESDVVWVYSGDIGTFVYAPSQKGNWEKRDYASGTDKPPAKFRRLRPREFR